MSAGIPESDILRPRPASLSNSDDWPEFELHDVTVRSPGTDKLVPLLHAGEHYPLTVTGTLQPLPAEQKSLYQPNGRKKGGVAIQLSEVRLFAYGEFENGEIALWAAGQAGWFVIKPSRTYKPIYAQMCEAVRVLYFIADAYRNKSAKKAMPVDELFMKYATEVMKDRRAQHQAAERIYRHNDFLFSCMLGKKEDLNWTNLPLYAHLQHFFPADCQAVKQRLVSPQNSVSGRGKGGTSEASSVVDGSKRKKGRPSKSKTEGEDDSNDVISVASSSAKSRTRSSTLTKKPTNAPDSRPGGVRRVRNGARSSVTSSPSQPATPVQAPEQASETSETSDSDVGLKPRRVRKGQSALRPKASKSGKGTKGPAARKRADDDEEGPHTSPTGSKRKSDDLPRQPQQKRRSRRHAATEESNDDESNEYESEDVAPSSPPSSSAEADDSGLDLKSVPQHLKESKDPLQEDTFACPHLGCSQKIYSSTSTLAQRLIDEHLASHSGDENESIRLIQKLQAPSLPAGRLMDKIRGTLGAGASSSGPGLVQGSLVAGTRFPLPADGRPVGSGVVVRY